uniref:HTH La-type RNA-binding domain-containing protein n=1 Tax=Kwoniella dejecticola CBS 10117 TaxID=1296121 RepID=A0A1A6ACM8_9TREE|nr:uncharacterized protein I303_02024 [Kwoniella dejecticola CBS 10117]OBR87811.1 hypothetical protein I303_02024 [Kwoniella dejecticola CBS 10117]
MSTPQQAPNSQQQPSAFHALGSYADRIKDVNGNPSKTEKPIPTAPASAESSLIPNGAPSKAVSRPSSATPSSSSSSAVKSRIPKSLPSPQPQSQSKEAREQDEDGSWETVRSNRQRAKQQDEKEKEKHGSNSKNWRDRSGQKQKPTNEENEKKGGQGKVSKKQSVNNVASTSHSLADTSAKPSSALPVPTKPAWGALTQSTKLPTSLAKTPGTSKGSRRESEQHEQIQAITVPSSPSLNGTTATANSVSIPPSVGSPNLSSETASTSTASASVLSKAVDKLEEEEGSWRAKQQPQVDEVVQPSANDQPVPARQAAPPPAVNAWDLRKKAIIPPQPPTSNQAKVVASTLNQDSNHQSSPQNHVKAESAPKSKKKTAARATSSAILPPINDVTSWPDVSQAAKGDEKKDKPKEKSTVEESSVVEDHATNTTTSKKQKWTAIPAAELLAAADQVAEETRRQHKAEAHARKRASASKADVNEASSTSAKNAGKPKKSSIQSTDGKKARTQVEGESRNQDIDHQSATPNKEASATGNADQDIAALTRQISKQSKAGSPRKGDQPLTSPTSNGISSELRLGNGPIAPQSRPMVASNTAPLPQQGFSNNTLPRVPRGRDTRQSLNGGGRGRGGFRSNSAFVHKPHQHFGSPPLGGNTNLPNDGFVNGNGYARRQGQFGGFQPFYPVQGYGQPNASVYDPMQAQYGAGSVYRPGLPPPPMPQTVVPNLDATRFYVLGQIEYYFSMQNLAMDFFLRQQMDSEGWIDIAMIASFNRVKSLTPDVAIVKDCMTLSSLLEVREESVRLAGQDAPRWVLPDAKPSKFPVDQSSTTMSGSPSQLTEESRDLANNSNDISITSDEGSSLPPPPRISGIAAEVENALMKNSSAAPAVNGAMPDEKAEEGANADKQVSEKARIENKEEVVRS